MNGLCAVFIGIQERHELTCDQANRCLPFRLGSGGLRGPKGWDIPKSFIVLSPTMIRWSKAECGSTIDKQAFIAELRWVVERLVIFEERKKARLWLQSAHPHSEVQRAYDLTNVGRAHDILE